jgi:hypothetical protein
MTTDNTIGVHYSVSCNDGYVKILKSDYEKLLYHYDISSVLTESEAIIVTLEYKAAKLKADISKNIRERFC